MSKLLIRGAFGLIAGLVFAVAAAAQIRIGQSSGFTGPAAAAVKEMTGGARLYFDAVNARGGVGGLSVELVSLDDQFDPKLTLINARKLIDQGVTALFLTHGTAHSLALIPLLNEFHIALVAPSTGAMDLHQPVQPWVFNVRAPYQREVERAVRHLISVGVDRIAIIQVDDAYGNDAVKGAYKAFETGARKPLAHEKYDRAKPNFAVIVPRLAALQPQAVLFLGSGDTVVEGIRKLREAGSQAQIVTTSNNAAAGFIKQMGAFAHGTIVSQVFPNERSVSVALVKEALELAAATKGAVEVTPVMLEGFAGAKVLVEGLRRAGREPSRASLRTALEGMHKFDLGGFELSFSPTDHSGLEFSDIAIIGPDGKFRR